MVSLFRSLCSFIGFLVIVAAALFYGRHSVVEMSIRHLAERATGFPLSIASTRVSDSWPIRVDAANLLLANPLDFPRQDAIRCSDLQVELGEPAYQNGRLEVKQMRLVVDAVTVIRNRAGEVNLYRLRGARDPGRAEAAHLAGFHFVIRELELSIGRVEFYDYAAHAEPAARVFSVGLDRRRFQNVTDPVQIQQLILNFIVRRTPIRLPGLALDTVEGLSAVEP